MLVFQTCPMSLISIWGLCREAKTDNDVVLELVLRLTTSVDDNFVDKIQKLAFQTCTWAGLEVNWLERLYRKRSSYKFEIVTWSSALKFDQFKKNIFVRFGFIRQNVSRVFPSILKWGEFRPNMIWSHSSWDKCWKCLITLCSAFLDKFCTELVVGRFSENQNWEAQIV